MNPITTSIDTLYLVARSILTAAEEVLDVNGVTKPTNRFVSWNAPAWDCCDHLVTHVDTGLPSRGNGSGQANIVCATTVKAQVILTLIGCVPVSDPSGTQFPSTADLDLSARMLLRQAWVLYQGLICAYFEGELITLLDPPIPCQIVKIGNLVPHGPQGGCASFTITFDVELA